MEAHKNAIVRDMLQKVKPHVDAHGHLHLHPEDTIPEGWVGVCRAEHDTVPRILLLTIMSNQVHRERGWPAMSRCKDLLVVLQSWFKAAVGEYTNGGGGGQPVLLAKIVELLAVLPLELDVLLEFKFGRILKRLVSAAVGDGAVGTANGNGGLEAAMMERARLLYERWSAMADAASAGTDSTSASASASAGISTGISTGTSTNTSNDQTHTKIVGKAVLIEQPTTLPATQPTMISTRPMSADDIQRDKKRRAYLESIGVSVDAASKAPSADISYTIADTHYTTYTTTTDPNDAPPGLSTVTPLDIPIQPPSLVQPPPLVQPPTEQTPTEQPLTTREIHPDAPVNKKVKTDREDRKDRRVSFPDDPALLVQVRLFQSDHLDDDDHTKVGPRGQQGEASYAFDRLRDVMEAECEWHLPRVLNIGEGLLGKTAFMKREEERECKTLSVSHHSADAIPPNPTMLPQEATSDTRTITIPPKDLHNAAPITRHLKTFASPPSAAVSPEVLSALLSSISGAVPLGAMPPRQESLPPPPPPKTIPVPAVVKKRTRPACKFYKEGVPGSCRSGASCPFRHGVEN